VVGVVRSGCAQNEDIFLSEVQCGGKVELKSEKWTCTSTNFCARSQGYRLKKTLNLAKIS
jgi:hypothetical protein